MSESNLTAFPKTEEWLRDNCANAELDVPAFQRRIFLDVLAILVERRRPNRVQLASRQHWLEHLRRVHRTFG